MIRTVLVEDEFGMVRLPSISIRRRVQRVGRNSEAYSADWMRSWPKAVWPEQPNPHSESLAMKRIAVSESNRYIPANPFSLAESRVHASD
jgi:hypothetical protein